MDIFYPRSVLPYPTVAWGHNHLPTTVSHQRDDNTIRQQRTLDTLDRRANANWHFSGAQFRLFRSWVVRDLANGSKWFVLWAMMQDGEIQPFRARFQDGQFTAAQANVDTWHVSAALDVQEQ